MSAEHECARRTCRPDLFPPAERQGEHHIAVRWGIEHCLIFVSLDGVVLDDATEALAGAEGWAIRDSGHEQFAGTCYCGRCEYVQRGVVRVGTDRVSLEGGE